MTTDPPRPLLRDLRWPLLVLAVGAIGTATAFVLDRTPSYEYALTVGAPSLWVLTVGAVWLLVAAVLRVLRRRGDGDSDSSISAGDDPSPGS